MELLNGNKSLVFDTPLAKGFLLGQTPAGELVELYIEPNGVVPAHSLPFDVVFYVVEGTGTVTLNGHSGVVSAGDVVTVEPMAQREWKNTGTTLLKLLVMKQISPINKAV